MSAKVKGITERVGSTHLAVDELDVFGALGITVSGSILGSSSVAAARLGDTSIGVHLDEVERSIESTGELGDWSSQVLVDKTGGCLALTPLRALTINVESKFPVLELEHLVLGVRRVEQIETGADVLLVRIGYEAEGEVGAGRGHSICAFVVGTVDGAVRGAPGKLEIVFRTLRII